MAEGVSAKLTSGSVRYCPPLLIFLGIISNIVWTCPPSSRTIRLTVVGQSVGRQWQDAQNDCPRLMCGNKRKRASTRMGAVSIFR